MEEIQRSLGRLEGKVDILLDLGAQRDASVKTLDRRVTAVESRVNRAYGVAAGVSAVVGCVGYVIHLIVGR